MNNKSRLFIGLLSGTSRDGADAVLVEFSEQQPRLLQSLCVAYPDELAAELGSLVERGLRPDETSLQRLDRELGDFFALVAWSLLERAGVTAGEVSAIGSHGQTVWHHPFAPRAESIQLGNAQRIADALGITTVGLMRQADLQAGGQGAPLAPLLHRALLRPESGVRAVVNIGGIANISLLQPDGSVRGWDTGPGNCLLDGWIRHHHGQPYDEEGGWAAGGRVDSRLLELLLADRYFHQPPPKSTGVEHFNREWLKRGIEQRASNDQMLAAQDIQATLSQLTAASIASAAKEAGANELLVCGGGARNRDLLRRLATLLPGCWVDSTARFGIDPEWMEGILFAWLARERLAGRAQDTRSITGASKPVLLGEIFEPRG